MRKLFFSLMVTSAVTLSGCSTAVQLATSRHADHRYVGHVELGKPVTVNAVTRIPLAFDGGEWMQNSGVVIRRIDVSAAGGAIEMKIVTCAAGGRLCLKGRPELVLPNLAPGTYAVFYRDPDGTRYEQGRVVVGGE